MTLTAFLQELRQRGVAVSRDGDNLKVQGPRGALSETLRTQLASHKPALMEWLSESRAVAADLPICPTDPARRHEPFALSDMQRGFYMADDPYMEFHVRPHYYQEREVGDLDVPRYEAAWNKALARHRGEIVVVDSEGNLVTVRDPAPLRCKVLDLRDGTAQAAAEALAAVRAEMMRGELPLDRWPWVDLRVSLWNEDGATKTRVHYNHNNFFSDGFGTTRLLQEIDLYYRDPEAQLPPLTLSFRDAAVALAELARSPAGQAAREYWEQRLEALPGPPPLPGRNLNRRCRSNLHRRERLFAASTWAAFKTNASRAGVTPSNAIFSAYAEVMATWSNSRHFVLSNMMTRRLAIHPEIRDIVGNFASLYPLEIDFRKDDRFVDRARRIQEQVIRDARHLQWGGMDVMQALNRHRGDLGNAAVPFVIGSGLFMEGMERADFSCLETSQVMLDHQFWELRDGRLFYVWDLLEEFFPAGLIDSMWEAYASLIERLAFDPESWQLPLFDLVSGGALDERARVCPPPTPLANERLQDFLLAAAAASPDALAVITPRATACFTDIERASGAIAARLAVAGVGPGSTVALVADRGIGLVTATYGVLKAGGVYLPIDASLPEERRRYLLSDSKAAAVLTERRHASTLAWPDGVAVLVIDDILADPEPTISPPAIDTKPTDLAYLIYTSGSTGVPKGVMIDHRGAVNTVLDVNRRFAVGPADRIFGVSSFSFDLSVYDLFGAAAAGAALVYPDPADALNPAHWLDVMLAERVTIWNSAPPLAVLFIEAAESRGATLPDLRLVMLSGDWIPTDLPSRIRRIAPAARIVSLGGATEASIWSILYEIDEVDPAWPSIPYGYPMQNQSWHVLDAWGRPAPVWTAGELFIGGVGLAKGYWNDPEKTAASFAIHPARGERLYRTGDLGRYLPGGVIEFLGRRDAQVKIQGHRIELGEIETQLAACEGVSAAVAAVHRAPGGGSSYLVAFVVPKPGEQPAPAVLREKLSRALPEYMVPKTIGILDRIPLNSNGKVDRKALPQIDEPVRANSPVAPREPRDDIERRLQEIWRRVLKRDDVGVADDFFDLGGQSFEAVRIIGAIRDAFGMSISLGAIWTGRTIERVAEQLRSGTPIEEGPLVSLRSGSGQTLMLVHPAGGHVMCYQALAEQLERPVVAFQAPGIDGRKPALESISGLAAIYVEAIERAHPDGPLLLGGWSSGALIAFEMAIQLRRRGREVMGAVLIDCPSPCPHESADDEVLLAWFLEDLALGLPVQELTSGVDISGLDELAQLRLIERSAHERALDLGLQLEPLAPVFRVFKGIVSGSRRYQAARADVDLLLVRAADGAVSEFAGHPSEGRLDWGWQEHTSGHVEAQRLPGTHHTLLTTPQLTAVAKTIRTWLAKLA